MRAVLAVISVFPVGKGKGKITNVRVVRRWALLAELIVRKNLANLGRDRPSG